MLARASSDNWATVPAVNAYRSWINNEAKR